MRHANARHVQTQVISAAAASCCLSIIHSMQHNISTDSLNCYNVVLHYIPILSPCCQAGHLPVKSTARLYLAVGTCPGLGSSTSGRPAGCLCCSAWCGLRMLRCPDSSSRAGAVHTAAAADVDLVGNLGTCLAASIIVGNGSCHGLYALFKCHAVCRLCTAAVQCNKVVSLDSSSGSRHCSCAVYTM
jgi:hypothetical protein